MRKEIKSLHKLTKRKQKKRSKKRRYESSDDSESDSEQDDGSYKHGIMTSDVGNCTDSLFKTNNDHLNSDSDSIITPNENIAQIKFVNQSSKKQAKVVTGVGTCSTIIAVP